METQPPGGAAQWPAGTAQPQGTALPADGTYVHHHAVGVYDSEKDDWVGSAAEDCLRLKQRADGGLDFAFQLIATNAHVCSMGGVAQRSGDAYEYRETIELSKDETLDCVLRLRLQPDRIVLEDAGQVCRRWYCGARAGIDGSEFLASELDPQAQPCVPDVED
jgi:hypothetical protein